MTTTGRVWAAMALGVLLASCATEPGSRHSMASRPDRGGIAGDAINLESLDPSVRDYLARVRDKIKSTWVFPCVTDPATQACEYKNAQIRLEFGILKNGAVQYVEVRQAGGAGLEIYDRHAMEAIWRASPFPVMPPGVVATLKEGSTGMPVVGRFNYVVDATVVVPTQTSRVGVVKSLRGAVTAQRAGLASPVPLKANDDVFRQDTITTGAAARIKIVLGGRVTVTMPQRSKVTITEVPGRSTLDLLAGQLTMALAGERMSSSDEVHVKTPNAVAAIRGGIRLSVETSTPPRARGAVVTEIDVLEGSVDVVPTAGSATATRASESTIRLRAKQGVTITGTIAGPIRSLRKSVSPTK